MVRADRLDIDPNAWTPNHLAVNRRGQSARQQHRADRTEGFKDR